VKRNRLPLAAGQFQGDARRSGRGGPGDERVAGAVFNADSFARRVALTNNDRPDLDDIGLRDGRDKQDACDCQREQQDF